MPQTSLTVDINCDPETLWIVLGDMVKRPERYEEQVTLKRFSPGDGGKLIRSVERQGAVHDESIELHLGALMVELTKEEPHLSLIHQIVPSGDRTILNLAATWTPVGSEPLDDTARTVDTITIEAMEQRLANLGNRIQLTAEALASQRS